MPYTVSYPTQSAAVNIVQRAEEAKERAAKLMREEGFKDDLKFTDATAALERSAARLRVIHRHRSRRGTASPESEN